MKLTTRSDTLLGFLGGLLLAIPVSLVAGAAAALVVSLVAMLATLVVTHSPYQMVLAPSYGVAADAQCSLWLACATALWQFAALCLQRVRLTGIPLLLLAGLAGAICGAFALVVQQGLALFTPLRLQHTSLLWSDGPGLSIMLLSGACGGLVALWRMPFAAQHLVVQRLALFAAGTALLAEGTIALRTALGLV